MKPSLIGHYRQREWFRNAIRSHRLASTFLFIGPEGIGKRTFALFLAKAMFCERVPAKELEPCETCTSCVQVSAGTHPDILQVGKLEDRQSILLETLIGPRDARMQEGLCHDIRLKPMSGDRRVAIIDDCDVLNSEGANALLKTLEEPPPKALIFLIGTSLQRQLPTIRSRCQVVKFDVPSGDDAWEILRHRCRESEISEDEIEPAMKLAGNDPTKAANFLHEEVRDFGQQLYRVLDEDPPEAVALSRLVTPFVEVPGTESRQKRERMRQVSVLATDFYRGQIRSLASADVQQSHRLDVEASLYRLQRSLDLRYQIDRNANLGILMDCWAYDLQRGLELEE